MCYGILQEKKLQDRGALPSEEGYVMRKFNERNKEKFFSSWLREDLVGKEERRKEDKEIREVKRKERGKGEKEENETVTVERRCVTSVATEAFDICSQGEDLESCVFFLM